MTIAFDSAVESPGVAAADPQNISVTVPALCRAVEVYVGHPGGTDEIVGVTLGGVAMARIGTINNSSASPGRVYKYGLGTGVPTGVRTVSIDRAPGSVSLFHVVITCMTALNDCEVVDFQTVQGFVSDPQVLLQYGGRTCLGLVGMESSFDFVLSTANEMPGQTRVHDHDFGVDSSLFSRQTVPANSDTTLGYTMATGQIAMIGTAWSEVADELPAPSVPQSQAGSVIRSSESLKKGLQSVKVLADLVKLLEKELPELARSVMTYEAVAVLTYGLVVRPGGSLSRTQYIRVTNGTAFQVANPDRPREGAVIRLDIHNMSGGVMGAITFGDQYALNGAFTNPANTKHRVISFFRSPDGKWRELSRSTNDLN